MRLPTKPLNPNLMWIDPPGTMRWLAGPGVGVGDAYTDCMSSCLGACNDMHATDPGALQACIAACPTTCFLYKVPAGGKPNQPTPCMTKCLNDAYALSDPTARTAAIAACPATCKLQQAAVCPSGYVKDANGQCVKAGPIGVPCNTGNDCAPGQICVNGVCVDCPGNQVRNAQGECGPPAVAASSSSGWGLGLLAAAAVGGIFLASKGQLKELGQRKANPSRKRRRRRRR